MRRLTTAISVLLVASSGSGCRHLEPLSPASSHIEAPVGDRCDWAARKEDGTCGIYDVTLGELVSVPEKFHGKPVRVRGYVTLRFEGNTICDGTTPAAACLWLNVDEIKDPGFRKGWAQVEGRFSGEDRGHFGCCAGALSQLGRITLLKE